MKLIKLIVLLIILNSCSSNSEKGYELSPTETAREQILGKWELISVGVLNDNNIEITMSEIPEENGLSYAFYADKTYVREIQTPNSTEKDYGDWFLENMVIGLSYVEDGKKGTQYEEIYELSNDYLALIAKGGVNEGDYGYWRFRSVK